MSEIKKELERKKERNQLLKKALFELRKVEEAVDDHETQKEAGVLLQNL